MSSRGAKRSSDSSESSLAKRKRGEFSSLVRVIEEYGVEMPPCSYCVKNKLSCVKVEGSSSRCLECVKLKRSCNMDGPSEADYERILREHDKIRAERSATKAALRQALAKLDRLEKQEELLRKRGAEMARRGIESLEELEAAEEEEAKRLEEERLSAGPSVVDPSVLVAEPMTVEEWDAWVASLGADGGTPLPSVSSS